MRAAHTVAQVRAAEERLAAALPPGALMQRAAAGLARRCALVVGRVYGARVVLLVGAGNNGGDALYAGALLAARGAHVTALATGREPHPGGAAALRRAGGRLLDAGGAPPGAVLAEADLVVDGLVGIGGRGGLREPAAGLAAAAAGHQAPVLAVDVPSGVDADTGEVAGTAVRADLTVTFGTLKPGLVLSPGAEYAGLVELVDIGLGPRLDPAEVALLDAADVRGLLPRPTGESNKYARGVVGVVAGSRTYTGAAVLATGAAVAAGAGMVRYAGPAHPAELVRQRWPEAVVTVVATDGAGEVADPAAVLGAGRVQAWVVGPGLGTGDGAAAVLAAVLDTDVPVLVDADGLTVLGRLLDGRRELLRDRDAATLLTPHAGEFARLMGTDRERVEAARLGWVRRAAAELGATVLLKGLTTVVADPGGAVRVNSTATSWLATAGSGDVLSGACGALLAQGLPALEAGAAGAFLHGLAGRHAVGEGRPGDPPAEAPIAAADLLACWKDAERAVRGAGVPTRW